MKLLDGLLVLDFSQYLAGPSGALRLADLGARVIKIERPVSGDNSRRVILNQQKVGNDSLLFHTINRNKESIALNLKDENDLKTCRELIKKADVMIENNRPGIMTRLGLDFDSVKSINPQIIYASVSGYGSTGPWSQKPGQDLLAQSLSGLAYLNGNQEDAPTPMALSLADSFTGIHLVQGILSALLKRNKTKQASLIEVNLLTSIIAVQFEGITTFLNNNNELPTRSSYNNANAFLAAPYGIYETKDSFISLAMGSLSELATILNLPKLSHFDHEDLPFEKRDDIKMMIGSKLKEDTTNNWLKKLERAGYWASPVLNWKELIETKGYHDLDLDLILEKENKKIHTTTCPIKVNGKRIKDYLPAPLIGEHTAKIKHELISKEGSH